MQPITLVKERQDRLRAAASPYSGKPLIVHSDLARAARFVERSPARDETLQRHVELLDSLGTALRIPAFNYQFPRTRFIDLRSDSVQLGLLNDFMLSQWAGYRSADPMYSFLTKQRSASPEHAGGLLIAFGAATEFATVVRSGGGIMMYGATLPALTMLHHIELMAGGPLYRYDKDFTGKLVTWEGRETEATYRYHVRPMGRHLDYDWPKLSARLQAENLMVPLDPMNATLGFIVSAAELVDCLVNDLRDDPLCLLDTESLAWVRPMLDRLGRRFILSDFESQ